MKAIVLKKFGSPENLKFENVTEPTCSPSQIKIQVKAIGLNFGDILIRQGFHSEAPKPPAIHGSEVSGVIIEIGSGLLGKTEFKVGDRVMGFLPQYGGFAEIAVAGPELMLSIPEGKTFEEAASFPVSFLAAQALVNRLGHPEKDENVLIKSASGGVGGAIIQLCKLRQTKIYTTSSPSKHEYLRQLGVNQTFSYEDDLFDFAKQNLPEKGFDVVFDPQGGKSLKESYRLLAPFGRLCIFGASAFINGRRFNPFLALKSLLSFPVFFPIVLMNQTKTVSGFGMLRIPASNRVFQNLFKEVTQLWSEGKVSPQIYKTYSLKDIATAQADLENRSNIGKIVLIT